jgi:50S ribosomal subunit-associated GTPase HflX
MASVKVVLTDLGLADRQTLLVWNKSDTVEPEVLSGLLGAHGGLAVSALKGTGLGPLLEAVERAVFWAKAKVG